MITYRFTILFAFLLLLGVSEISFAACTTTLNPGANVPSAVASAANGATICLNAGNYGTVNLFDISRSGYVTLMSTTGKTANISPQPGNSDYIRLESLTISDSVTQNSCSTHIQWVNNNFAGRGLTLTNSGCGNLDTLIDGNSFTGFNVGGGYEGRLSLVYGSGITISNNYFGDGGASDGVQLVGNVSNVIIGPGNVFNGILESLCGSVHCDAIQLYGAGTGIVIEKNHFKNGDTFIMAPDGSSGVTVRNNVFDGYPVSYEYKIQFGSASNLIFEHNTIYNAGVAIDSKTGMSASTNATVRNNSLAGASYFKTSGGSGCSNCSFSYNLFDDGGSAAGTNTIIGTPIYVGGGTHPATWAGWQLTPASPGYRAGSDGQDIGSTHYDSVTVAPPATPSSLTVR